MSYIAVKDLKKCHDLWERPEQEHELAIGINRNLFLSKRIGDREAPYGLSMLEIFGEKRFASNNYRAFISSRLKLRPASICSNLDIRSSKLAPGST